MQKNPDEGGNSSNKNDILNDPRFSHLVNDPRFKQLPRYGRKVKIDKRFESMFNDSKFTVKYTVDKYGRKVNQTSGDDFKKYYDLDSSTDEEAEEAERREEERQILKDDSDSDESNFENDKLDNDGEVLSKDIKKKLISSGVDYARGEGRLLTDSSSDEDSSDDEDEVFIEHVWGELDNEAPRTDESTSRLAACNMNWDRIRASDIMVLCNSFLPPGGSILSVKIFLSEFGKERMKEEEMHGPPELTRNENECQNEDLNLEDEFAKEQDTDAEEGDEYHMEKLRQYQLNRLKYYYAVIECDSVATADKLYSECDGLEYESTATKLDLRFIPDDVTFDDDEPKDICTEMPDLTKYKPRLFTTTALQQVKVDLTWDEMSIERKELSEKLSSGKIHEVNPTELRKYIAYSSDEEEDGDSNVNGNAEEQSEDEGSDNVESEDDEKSQDKQEDYSQIKESSDKKKKKCKSNAISKYKSLLEEINKKENEQKRNKFEIEYSWGINIDNKAEKDDTDKNVIDKSKMTPIEKILEKKREKNKKRKEERRRKLKGSDDEDDNNSDDLPSDIDLDDPYFAEEFANGDFEPQKKSKEKLEKISTEKGRKGINFGKGNDDNDDDDDDDEDHKTKELELLLDDDNDNKNHFSLKKIQDAESETKSKKKRRKKIKKLDEKIVDDNFEVNVEDDRFKALYTSHLFNIDPSDPHFKKTKGIEKIIHEKLKRKYEESSKTSDSSQALNNDVSESKRPKKKVENSILIKSIKRKIQNK